MGLPVIFSHIFGDVKKPAPSSRGAFADLPVMQEARRAAALKTSADMTIEEELEEVRRAAPGMHRFAQRMKNDL